MTCGPPRARPRWGKKTVDFEDGATVTIGMRGRGTRGKVVDWTDHTPENLDTLKFVPDARSWSVGVSLYVKPDGRHLRLVRH